MVLAGEKLEPEAPKSRISTLAATGKACFESVVAE
jgi:hypothetical protein